MKESPGRPAILGLSHMTFQASEVDRALAYYRDVHGSEDQLRLTDPADGTSRAFVRINEAQWIELRPESAASPFPPRFPRARPATAPSM